MANVLGETGRYVSNQSAKKLIKVFVTLYFFGISIAFLTGYLVGSKKQYLFLLLLTMLPFLMKYLNKKIKLFENERLNFRKGYVGEAVVGYVLEKFPEDYRVIHDLTTPFGNIDHVVVGPSGVYIIDTKNWRGIITADGNGEILLNGKQQKPEIKNLQRTIMNIKEKIKILCGEDPYIQGILAFPSAYVEAKWGTTGKVHCMTDETLYDYIVEDKKSNKLNKKEVDSISHAFLALARMDREFENKE